MRSLFAFATLLAVAGGALAAPAKRLPGLELDPQASDPVRAGKAGLYRDSADGKVYYRKADNSRIEVGTGGGVTAAATFRFSLPPPNSGTTYTAPGGGGVFAIPIWIPADVTSVRIRLQNMAHNEGAYADVVGVNVAVGPSDGAQDFASAPTVYSGVTVGGVVPYVSPWTSVTRGSDGRVILAVSVPAGITVQSWTGANYRGRLISSSSSVYPLGGASSILNGYPYIAQLEYATAAKRVVVIGDSIAMGYNAYWDAPTLGASPYTGLGPDHGIAVYNPGLAGFRMYNAFDDVQAEESATLPQYRQDLAAVVKGAIVVIEVGINDLQFSAHVAGGVTAYQSYKVMLDKATSWLRAAGAKAIVVEAIGPCSSYEATFGAARVEYDKWVATLPFGIDAFIDRDTVTATSPRTAGTTINASYDSGDGCHLNATGEAAQEAAVFAVVNAL